MTFGEAIERLNAYELVARQGWNAKDMFLVLIRDWKLDHRDVYSTDL